jgi:peptidoglycan/xylan/chitin deacetylase (PgdA/CDA1 family)
VLDILQSQGARATFFLVGWNARQYPELTRRIVKEEHRVGGHTQNHATLTSIGRREAEREIDEGGESIAAVSGEVVRYFRPPHGSFDLRTLLQLRKRQVCLTMWSREPMPARATDTAGALQAFRKASLAPGEIILLHDDEPPAVSLLPELLEHLRTAGWRCEALPAAPRFG